MNSKLLGGSGEGGVVGLSGPPTMTIVANPASCRCLYLNFELIVCLDFPELQVARVFSRRKLLGGRGVVGLPLQLLPAPPSFWESR